MRRTIRIFGGTTVVLLLAFLVSADAQGPTPFKRTVLQQGDLSAPGREAVMALAEIQSGAASGRHTHPGEEIGYVLAGPLILEMDGKPAKTLQTGDAFIIPAGTVHNARNAGTGVAKVVATYVIEKGKPVATPVQ
jgi:quercetin dioxygenase-like cupin family protein